MCATKNLSHTTGYHDLYFRIALSLLASHIIIAFGEQESFFELLVMPDYYRSLLFSFIIAFILVTVVNVVTIRLDRRYGWGHRPWLRAILQALLGLLLPSILAFLLAFFYFSMYGLFILDTPYLKYDFPVIVLMLVLLNVYYLAYYFFRRWQIAERKSAEKVESIDNSANETKNGRETFLVQRGAQSIPLPVDTIAYFYRDGDYNYLTTFEEDRYLIPQTLDEVEAQLDKLLFFRANRQFIVHHKACTHFSSLDYGKLELFVSPTAKESIVISQRRAKSFKEWMRR